MITEQDLIDAVVKAKDLSTGDEEAMTASEIAEATGYGIKVVRRNIKKLMGQGLVKPVWVTRDTITTPLDGRRQRVPGYKFCGSFMAH